MPIPRKAASGQKRKAPSNDKWKQLISSKRAKHSDSESVETSEYEEKLSAPLMGIRQAQAQIPTQFSALELGFNCFSNEMPNTRDLHFGFPANSTLFLQKGPNGSNRNERVTTWPDHHEKYLKFYIFHVRFPHYRFYAGLELIYDTGARDMSIFVGDISGIMGLQGWDSPFLKVAGYVKITRAGQEETPNNTYVLYLASIEATIVNKEEDPAKERLRMTPWTRAWTTVNLGRTNDALGNHRFNGPWLCHRLYMRSMPDGTERIHAATSIGDLCLKKVHPRDTKGLGNDPPPTLHTPRTFIPITGRHERLPLLSLASIKFFGGPVFTDSKIDVLQGDVDVRKCLAIYV